MSQPKGAVRTPVLSVAAAKGSQSFPGRKCYFGFRHIGQRELQPVQPGPREKGRQLGSVLWGALGEATLPQV